MNESVATRTWTFEEDGTIDEVVLQLNMSEKYQNMQGILKHHLRQILHMFPADADLKVVCFGEMRDDGGGEINIQVTATPKMMKSEAEAKAPPEPDVEPVPAEAPEPEPPKSTEEYEPQGQDEGEKEQT